MDENMTLRRFAERFVRGDFNSTSRHVQVEAGWYDWFCKDESLCRRTKELGKKVLQLMNSPKINPDKMYVFFENNCPCIGPMYDQFSICDLETGDVVFCVQHLEKGTHGCEQAHWELYAEPEFETPAVDGSWRDVLAYFRS